MVNSTSMDPWPSFWAYLWIRSIDPNFSLSPNTIKVSQHGSVISLHKEIRSVLLFVFVIHIVCPHVIPWSKFPFQVIIVTGTYSVARRTQCNDSFSDMQLLPSTRCLPAWIRRDSCRAGRWVVATHAANHGRASLVLDPRLLQCKPALDNPLWLLPSFVYCALCLL